MRRTGVCPNGNAVFRITVHQPNPTINVVRDPTLCRKTNSFFESFSQGKHTQDELFLKSIFYIQKISAKDIFEGAAGVTGNKWRSSSKQQLSGTNGSRQHTSLAF